MSHGGMREGAGRSPGAANFVTRQRQQWVREIITRDEYAALIRSLYTDAMASSDLRVKLQVARFFAEYIEGKPKERIEISSAGMSVADVLRGIHNADKT